MYYYQANGYPLIVQLDKFLLIYPVLYNLISSIKQLCYQVQGRLPTPTLIKVKDVNG